LIIKKASWPISRVLYYCETQCGDHSSATLVTKRLKRPTRKLTRMTYSRRTEMFPYLVLLRVGFTLPPAFNRRGALLPHHFTLTNQIGGIFSVALSVSSRFPGVTWHSILWSPDFPLLLHPITVQVSAVTRPTCSSEFPPNSTTLQ
jgi:hypothetical protein